MNKIDFEYVFLRLLALIGITVGVVTLAEIVLLDIENLQETTTSGVEVTESPEELEHRRR